MEQLTTLLQQLAQQLGVSVEYLWPYLVRWTFAEHLSVLIVNLIGASISALFVFLSIKVLRSGWGKSITSDQYDTPSAEFFQVVGGLIGMIIFGFWGIVCLSEASHQVAGVLVPEAQAILDILAKMNPKK